MTPWNLQIPRFLGLSVGSQQPGRRLGLSHRRTLARLRASLGLALPSLPWPGRERGGTFKALKRPSGSYIPPTPSRPPFARSLSPFC